ECFAQVRTENLNVLAINFYNRTDYTVTHLLADADIEACKAGLDSCPLTADERATLQCFTDPFTNIGFCIFTDPVHFDFVAETIRLDGDGRTAPVVTVKAPFDPAPTGWYNAAVLGGQGAALGVAVDGEDFR